MGRIAYVDESYVAATSHYLLAAVVVDEASAESLRERTSAIRRRGRAPFHWYDELDVTRRAMVGHVARSTEQQIVVASRPVTHGREERARAVCLAEMPTLLDALEPPVHVVILESRTRVLDKRDVARAGGMQTAGRLPPEIRLSFGTKAEPLLWLADAVAGAVATDLTGDPRFVEILAPHLTHVVTRGVP